MGASGCVCTILPCSTSLPWQSGCLSLNQAVEGGVDGEEGHRQGALEHPSRPHPRLELWSAPESKRCVIVGG